MRIVATMTQTMRAHHCAAYLRRIESAETYVVVSNPRAFDTLDLPPTTVVLAAKPPPEILPTGRLLRSRFRQRVVNLARGGSKLGQIVEKSSRKILWRLRYVDRLVLAADKPDLEADGKVHSALLAVLEKIHAESPITQLVAFDVFDLPTLLRFQDRHGVSVIVR